MSSVVAQVEQNKLLCNVEQSGQLFNRAYRLFSENYQDMIRSRGVAPFSTGSLSVASVAYERI